MKHKGSISQTYLRRDREVLPELYRRAKRVAEYPTSNDSLFRIMADLPVDRYYIADDAAYEYVRKRHLHGFRKKYRTPQKQRLLESLYEEVTRMMGEERYRGLSLKTATVIALMRPAPCVGLSPAGIDKIFSHSRAKGHEKV